MILIWWVQWRRINHFARIQIWTFSRWQREARGTSNPSPFKWRKSCELLWCLCEKQRTGLHRRLHSFLADVCRTTLGVDSSGWHCSRWRRLPVHLHFIILRRGPELSRSWFACSKRNSTCRISRQLYSESGVQGYLRWLLLNRLPNINIE